MMIDIQKEAITTRGLAGKKALLIVKNISNPPIGAAARRARCIAKALNSEGWDVNVYHLHFGERPTEHKDCKEQGINYRYPSPFKYKGGQKQLKRLLKKCYALIITIVDFSKLILKKKRPEVVYIYPNELVPAFLLITYFNMLKIPVVKEYCEWLPAIDKAGYLRQKYFSSPCIKSVDGLLAISDHIEKKINNKILGSRKKPIVEKVPILIEDIKKQAYNSKRRGVFVWCGQVKGYFSAIEHLIYIGYVLKKQTKRKFLIELYGGCNREYEKKIADLVNKFALDKEIKIKPFVPADDLWSAMCSAEALLMPLFDDERSRARFPTKIGEYLLSGRPMISSHIGEITKYVVDEENALLAKPNDLEDFAKKMLFCLDNEKMAQKIGEEGRKLAIKEFHYLNSARTISVFFDSVSKPEFK